MIDYETAGIRRKYEIMSEYAVLPRDWLSGFADVFDRCYRKKSAERIRRKNQQEESAERISRKGKGTVLLEALYRRMTNLRNSTLIYQEVHEIMKKGIPFQNLNTEQIKDLSQGSSSLSARTESGATVVSAQFTVNCNKERFQALLSKEMEQLAAKVYDNGGIIGHIKASTDITSVQMYSITDTVLHVKEGEQSTIAVNMAVILVLIEPETAKGWVQEIMNRLIEATQEQSTEKMD